MRSFFLTLGLALAFTVAFAGGNCGSKCGKSCSTPCDKGPDWAYTYNSAFYMPDCAPKELHDFQDKLIPLIEARRTMEEAYVRENVACLYKMAKAVQKADPCCEQMRSKHYRRAAKELVRDCKRLKELAYGGPTSALYSNIKEVEEDFIQLANLCD
ncbi:MAG: hypothetical protein ACOZB3_11270 [Calditrichota bacterium]